MDEAIAAVNALNKDNYKDFSAVETAVNAVDRSKNITEQAVVDGYAKAINDAVAALEYKEADYSAVDAAIAAANALNKDNYKDFSAVDTAINAVERNKIITEQAVVDGYAKAINDAVAALEYKEADYSAVDAAIAAVNALNKDNYKDFNAVEAAINAVDRSKNITEQAVVDGYAKAINDAVAALEKKEVNFVKGDVDGNGTVELDDAKLALRAALRIATITPEQFKIADIDGDGVLALVDVQTILKIALKITVE